MPCNSEMMKEISHDVKGTCAQLQGALPLLEKLIEENDSEAADLLRDMADSAKKLSDKLADTLANRSHYGNA